MIKHLRMLLRNTMLIFGVLLVHNTINAQYCIPDLIYGTAYGDYIDGIELEDITNFSGSGTDWNDFTALSTTLNTGLTYDLIVYNNPNYAEYYAAWIDWDQDEVFSEDERLNATDLFIWETGLDTISFIVPFTALSGTTRMRIICVYYPLAPIDPCGAAGTYNYGEAEDYSIIIAAPGLFDLGVSDIEGLVDGCGLGITPLTVSISNFGTEPSGSFLVSYQLTDPVLGILPIVTEVYSGAAIPALTTVEYTFSSPVNLTNIGEYYIESYTTYGADMELLNDNSDQTITSIETIATFPYYEDYEGGSGEWVSGGAESSWELGDPDGFAIIGPPPATPASLNSWTTDLNGYYNLNEKSFVIAPCLDFTALILPYIEFDLNYDIQLFDDGAKLQYTIDEGSTWLDIGGIGTGDNWYNHTECYAMWPAYYVDNYNGWSGNSDGWLHAYHDLSFLAGEPSVRLRFVFASSSYWNFNDGFAFDNIFIGDPFSNDLGVLNIINPETGPFLTASETITIEIKNYGTLPKTGFPVSYRINGGVIHSEIFPSTLAAGDTATYTFASTENLFADGDYTFEAWTTLGSDADHSNDTINQIISNLLPVTGTSAFYIYSNITGAEPFYVNTNDTHLNDVFGVGNWTTDYFETVDPALLFSSGTCFVYLEGSDTHADELELFLDENIAIIENWVASGGHLLLNAAPTEGDGIDLGFGDMHLNYPWFSGSVEAVDAGHPVWSGAYIPTTTYMTGSSYGNASISGTGDIDIIKDSFNPDKIILSEKSWGAGTVIFGGMTMTDFHAPAIEAANFRKNLIDYLAICTISNNDVGVHSVLSPESACGLSTSESVTLEIKNYGFLPQTNIPVSFQIGAAGIPVTEVILGTLEVGATLTYTFTSTVDIGAVGSYELKTWTSLATDTNLNNDSTNTTINNIPIISSFPYLQDWESGDNAGWNVSGAVATWELGYPDGPVINTPPVATPSSEYSWTTGIAGNYNDNEHSFLESPCFDMSSLVVPYLEVDLWWYTEYLWDGLQLEYSTDGGLNWNLLGDIGTGDNWYNAYGTILGGNGWVGFNPGWVTAKHNLAFLAGEPSVKFRFFFGADGINNYDGIGLDNFRLQDPFTNDIGVTELISPVSGIDLSATEIVTINIKNFGLLPQSSFPVSYRIDGGVSITEIFTGTLDAGASELYTFTAVADLADTGFYEICAWTSLATDENITNDSIPGCETIAHLLPVSGTAAYYIYSTTVGYEPGTLLPNSTAMNIVFGEDAWTLNFYETLDPYTVFNATTCFVFLEASENHWLEFEAFFNNNQDLIEGWVSSGGNLFINASPSEGDGGEVGFGGVTITYPYFSYSTIATDTLHPVLNGPFTPVTADLFGFYVGNARTSGIGIVGIINDQFCDTCYVLSEKNWDNGTIIFGNLNAPEYYSPVAEAQNLLQNIVDYLKLCAPVDLGVTELISPEGGCGMTNEEEVTILITNFGPTTVLNIPVNYQLDGLPIVSVIAEGPVPIGGTYIYTFETTADLSSVGLHILETWTDFSGDADETNDLITSTLTSFETPILDFGPNITICDEIILDAGNLGSIYEWSTGASTQTIPVTATGVYSVTVTNAISGCSITDDVSVTVNYTPIAGFTYIATGLSISFTNTSTDGGIYNWNFGDGSTSTEENPSHIYDVEGSYTVTVTVSNGCGSAFYTLVIDAYTEVIEQTLSAAVSVHPNPTSDKIMVTVNHSILGDINFELVNSFGEVVWITNPGAKNDGTFEINMTSFASGLYQLNINTENESATKQIVVIK